MGPPVNVLALIPARGGSKSIPRKNIRLLAGKPLVAYSIEAARASATISRVIVSTDDEEIAAVAREFGADVPFMRPGTLAQDDTPDLPVFEHALRWLREHEQYEPAAIVHLRPTCPLRQPATIDRAVRSFLARADVDSLRSVSVAEQNPFKMWLIGDGGVMRPVASVPGAAEAYNMPRQSLPRVFWQNGYVDVTRPATIAAGTMNGGRILGFVVDEPLVDLDYEDHFRSAEAMLRAGAAPAPRAGSDRFPS
jgi:N-acylneuraminate cytidylyltransferase